MNSAEYWMSRAGMNEDKQWADWVRKIQGDVIHTAAKLCDKVQGEQLQKENWMAAGAAELLGRLIRDIKPEP